MNIESFDGNTASDAVLHEYYDFRVASELEREPDDPFEPFEVWLLEMQDPASWTKQLRWLARDGDDLVGSAHLELHYVETNRHLAFFDITVRADRRREGVGTVLLETVRAAAKADGRRVIETYVASTDDDAGPSPFLELYGFEKRMVERRSSMPMADVDRAMLEGWVDQAEDRAGEYTLIGFEDVCPDDYVQAYVDLNDVMNTAPIENLDMEDWHWTVERLREAEELRARVRKHQWTLIARHEPSGELAGFTEVQFGDWMGDLAWQGDTGVDPKHREKGLGRWLKAAMALRILDEKPEIARVDTWNAGSNRPMLAINVAMGFRPVRYYGNWQKDI